MQIVEQSDPNYSILSKKSPQSLNKGFVSCKTEVWLHKWSQCPSGSAL